jgi:hypothetical protein
MRRSVGHIQTTRELLQLNKKARVLERPLSWLKRGQKVPFLREICSPKKCTPFSCAPSGIIAGELLNITGFYYLSIT